MFYQILYLFFIIILYLVYYVWAESLTIKGQAIQLSNLIELSFSFDKKPIDANKDFSRKDTESKNFP